MPATSVQLPPPVGGWDTREALSDMPADRAAILDNWFPSTDRVTLRRGYVAHATGLPGTVDTLMAYTPAAGSQRLFAASGAGIYEVTTAGAVGAPVVSGLTSVQFQHVNVATAGGQFLFACNGRDTPKLFNGTTWADTTITGPTVANLAWCTLHQGRLWVGEANSLDAWYGAVPTAIGGAFTKFSLNGLVQLGGFIMAVGTWSRDGGSGADDLLVFLTSEGEAVVYKGTDPNSLSTWSMVGVYRIGKPIGRRCMIKAGPDLVLLTQDGAVTVGQILPVDRSQADTTAITSQISKAFNDAVRAGSALFGWQPFLYPRGTMLLFNVPQATGAAQQFVFNTITKAPCRFTGIPARCWGLLGDDPYFGASGQVCRFDTSGADAGAAIVGDALPAFSYFGSPGRNKLFTMVEPLFESDTRPSLAVQLCTDLAARPVTAAAAIMPTGYAVWGRARWGRAAWAPSRIVYRGWRGVRGIGRSASLRVRLSSTSGTPSWLATSFVYTPGGLI